MPRSGRGRSGCSRSTPARRAPPSTTSRWRATGISRSTARASASAARRTSVKSHRGSMRTFTWMPRDPEVFGKPTSPWASSTSCTTPATWRTASNGTPGLRIEVDAQLVGVVDVVAADRPRVQVEAPEVHRPHEVGDVDRAQLVGGAAARERDPHGLQPLGALLGHPLLEERLAERAVGEALQHGRALEDAAQGALADGEVVVDEVELGLAAGREEDLVRIGDPHRGPVHVDFDRGSRHAPTLLRRCQCEARDRPPWSVSRRSRSGNLGPDRVYSLGSVGLPETHRSPSVCRRRGREPTFFVVCRRWCPSSRTRR